MIYASAAAVSDGNVVRSRRVSSGNIPVGLTSVGKIGLTLALPLAGPLAHAMTYLLLAGWALAGPRRALEALTLTWLVTFLNPGIYDLSEAATILRWLVVGCAGLSVVFFAGFRRTGLPRALLWLLAFTGVVAVMAMAVSYAPDVSLFKLLSFSLAVGTILLGFETTKALRGYWEGWFLGLFGTVVVVSVPLVYTDVGFFRNQRGFQGILNHPQAYGTFLGAMLAWVLLLRVEGRGGRWLWPVLGAALMSLVLTQARTGMVATVVALVGVGIWKLWLHPGRLRLAGKWGLRLSPLVLLLLAGIVVQGDAVRAAVLDFMLKGNVEREVEEAFYRSRGFVILQSWENFEEQPLTGIGFGVASNPSDLDVSRASVLSLPVGAAVEKGFTPTASLEEVGLIGSLLLLAFLMSWLKPVLRRGASPAALGLAAAGLLVNVGEAILFALGGTGLLAWLLLGAARSSALESES